jgi:hypothetical protein
MQFRLRFDVLLAIALTTLSVLLHNLPATLALSGLVSLVTLNRWDRHLRKQKNASFPGLPERLLVVIGFWVAGGVCGTLGELTYAVVTLDALSVSVRILGCILALGCALATLWLAGALLSRQANALWSPTPVGQP